MSDFLTNLVIRSFSGAPSFQPLATAAAAAAEPSYVEPEEPVTHERPVRTTDQTDEEKPIGAPPLVEAPLAETPLIETPLIETPLVETPLVETPLVETLLVETPVAVAPSPKRIREEVVRTEPEKFESPKAEFTEKSVIPPSLETRKPPVNLTAPPPAVRTSSSITPPPQPVLQTPVENRSSSKREVRRKPAKAISLPPPPAAPSQKPRASIRTHKAEPRIVEQVIEKLVERPAVMIENTQEISTSFATSFTTLVPKPTAQPLPSVNIKTRPNLPAIKPPDETEPAPLQAETVINVAIGRIEVRATPAAAPRRERQSPGPKVMTLDDYLQQRSRGAK
jgi:ribonuclease E